jgi:hypothetical protein
MVINVRSEFEKKQAAKPPVPKPPTQTVSANQRENRAPAPTQTLNLYGSPASIAAAKTSKPVVTPKPSGSTIPAPKTSAQIAADAQKILDELNAISKRLDTPVASGSTGAGRTVLRSVTNADGTVTIFYSDGTSETFGTPTTPTTPAKKEVIPNVAYDTIEAILRSYNITDIASVLNTIRDEYPEASSEDVLTLLQFDSRYNAKFNARFAANVERQKAGKPVLSPGEYLKLEQGYIKIFNAYNLPTFKTQSYYDKFIKEDLDVVEVTDRVQLAFDRVLNDEPTKNAFNKFFSALGFSDIVAGMLDPINQIPALERKVKAAEIGGAALRQGLTASELAMAEEQASVPFSNITRGTLGADVLAQQGVTKAQAEAGFRKIAEVLPTAEKLSSIYGGTEAQYGRLEAEQEQLQGLASAARKRQKLSELEAAQFRKSSGLGRGALSSPTNI